MLPDFSDDCDTFRFPRRYGRWRRKPSAALADTGCHDVPASGKDSQFAVLPAGCPDSHTIAEKETVSKRNHPAGIAGRMHIGTLFHNSEPIFRYFITKKGIGRDLDFHRIAGNPLPATKCQITFQDQRCCHRIHSILALFAVIIMQGEKIVRLYSSSALIPHRHRQSRSLSELLCKGFA